MTGMGLSTGAYHAATYVFGWDGVFAWDDISVDRGEVWDPWVVLGSMAAVTQRLH